MSEEAGREANAYYDSRAQSFFDLWGGENIHFGIYRSGEESLYDASTRATEDLYGLLTRTRAPARVLDLGSGFGGPARFLAERGHRVTCIDASEENNRVNRQLNEQRALDSIVLEGHFERTSQPDASFDVVWSQEAICHSESMEDVFGEAWRVLRSGGEFALSNTCCGDEISDKTLSKLNRRNSLTLRTIDSHSETARASGFTVRQCMDLSAHLSTHYRKMLEELEKKRESLIQRDGEERFTRMSRGLEYWLNACDEGNLAWGMWLLVK